MNYLTIVSLTRVKASLNLPSFNKHIAIDSNSSLSSTVLFGGNLCRDSWYMTKACSYLCLWYKRSPWNFLIFCFSAGSLLGDDRMNHWQKKEPYIISLSLLPKEPQWHFHNNKLTGVIKSYTTSQWTLCLVFIQIYSKPTTFEKENKEPEAFWFLDLKQWMAASLTKHFISPLTFSLKVQCQFVLEL